MISRRLRLIGSRYGSAFRFARSILTAWGIVHRWMLTSPHSHDIRSCLPGAGRSIVLGGISSRRTSPVRRNSRPLRIMERPFLSIVMDLDAFSPWPFTSHLAKFITALKSFQFIFTFLSFFAWTEIVPQSRSSAETGSHSSVHSLGNATNLIGARAARSA